jgi:hypothetical protein
LVFLDIYSLSLAPFWMLLHAYLRLGGNRIYFEWADFGPDGGRSYDNNNPADDGDKSP